MNDKTVQNHASSFNFTTFFCEELCCLLIFNLTLHNQQMLCLSYSQFIAC